MKRKPIRHKPRVFIVYGHDRAKDDLATFLRKLGVEPIIIGEQARGGRHLLEAVEYFASKADYAIVLLTGDDEGHIAGHSEEKKPRARQNVVLEMGYCLGVLGRKKIMVLYRRGVDLPSDLHGLHYWAFDRIEDVQLRVVQEMKAAGLDVDANRAF